MITKSKASELTRRGVNMVLYSSPGAGKTTLAADLADSPHGKPVYFIDVEGGTSAISHRSDIHVSSISNPKGWEDLEAVCNAIIDGKERMPDGTDIGTLVIDNLSEIIALSIDHVKRTISRNIDAKDRPDQNDWGKVNSNLLVLVRKLRDFSRNSTTNVIFIAWELAEENEMGQVVKNTILANPAFRRTLPGLVDHVAYLTVRPKGVRQLSFEPSRSTDAKFRRNQTEIANTIPLLVRYVGLETKPLCDIIATLRADVPFPRSKYTIKTDD